ncbi:MAG: hypothetical protein FD123_485 [Bacteroidetes bacterium]|nr:MAG: hypothetical protein FD123_485 [Bacteroidota bacterium]
MAFNAFYDKQDSSGNRSVLSYAQSGSAPNRILKIQYKNVGQSGTASELLSYQLWLKEGGALEVHIGPHTQLTAEAGFDTTMIAYVTEGDSMILHTNYPLHSRSTTKIPDSLSCVHSDAQEPPILSHLNNEEHASL